ncbi:hypothetical protein [Embleya sp. MST-111070]|uniref:hypothetical protein n=1 Tax=Embleya sp. MST-111070 TaxID=3398231 RepID=UPI003F73F538
MAALTALDPARATPPRPGRPGRPVWTPPGPGAPNIPNTTDSTCPPPPAARLIRRRNHNRGILDHERARALAELGMIRDPADARRQAGLAAARAFHTRHGHLRALAR